MGNGGGVSRGPSDWGFRSPGELSFAGAVMWRDFLWVGFGGALGSMARFGAALLTVRYLGERLGETLPWGTLAVNIAGSLAIGFLSGLATPDYGWLGQPSGRHFLLMGVCGGFTTFSSFSVQTLRLIQNRAWVLAGINVVGSVVVCLAAVWAGHLLAVAVDARRG